MTRIHCFSCGRDTVLESVKQKTGKPIERCKNCKSRHFVCIEEVLDEKVSVPGSGPGADRPDSVESDGLAVVGE